MSSGQKRCNEDEDDWYDFLREVGLINRVSWRVYSREAANARDGYYRFAFTEDLLVKFVELSLEIESLVMKRDIVAKEKQLLKELKRKYENA